MSDCRKCTDPDCPGGYKGGSEQLWVECRHVDSRPMTEKLTWLVDQLGSGQVDSVAQVERYLRRWLDDARPRYVSDESDPSVSELLVDK